MSEKQLEILVPAMVPNFDKLSFSQTAGKDGVVYRVEAPLEPGAYRVRLKSK